MPPGERPPQFRPPIEKTTTYEARIKEPDIKAPGTKDPGHKDEGEAVFILAVVVAVGYGVYYTGKGAYYGGYYTCKGIGNAYSFIGRQFSKEPREKEPQVKATKMKEPRVKTPDVEQAQVKQPQVKEPQMYVPRTRGPQVHSSREKTKARKREWRNDGSSFIVPLLRKNSEEEEDEKEALILAEKRNKKFERDMALVCGGYVSGVGTMIPLWRLRVVQSTDTHKTQNAQYIHWMNQVVQRTHPLLHGGRRRKDPLVKIAILDSGVDKHFHALKEVPESRGFDPVPEEDYFDRVGHGTHSIGLLRRVAPNASIYVAKVTEADESRKEDVPNHVSMANAIDHAVTDWEVDIITISLGLPRYHRDVAEAIDRATARSILVFAAAGNNGKNQSTSFPASYSNVIPIYSCDGHGNAPDPDTNPAPSTPGERFCTLGEGVESSWLGTEQEPNVISAQSGTSRATPIAAATAALVLEFASQASRLHYPDEAQPEYPEMESRLWYLRSPDGMRRVLRDLLSTETSGGQGYRYIKPWELLDVRKGSYMRDDAHKAVAHLLAAKLGEYAE
ncbi:unnamed protein product [Alternaria alternata]